MTTRYEDIHRDIIEACMAGDVRAQYQLYSLYNKAMYNVCLRMLNQVEEAEDILQEAFTYAFKKMHSFRFESSFGAWLKRIVVNTCINHLKKKKVDLVSDEGQKEAPAADAYQDDEESKLKVESIMRAMKQLPEGYRVVFSLYLLEGYDHREISEILGISESTSKSQFSRSKKKLQEILNSYE